MSSQTSASSTTFRREWFHAFLLLGLFATLYLFMQGTMPLANPDEGRYSEIPREMLSSGDWVTPRLNGVVYFEKPPLVYWLGALSQKAFGSGELAARLPNTIFALFGLFITYIAGRRLHSHQAGLLSTFILGTSLLYFALGRILTLDMAVSVLMASTLFCFIAGMETTPGPTRRLWFYGLYASAALATLSKGLIGFLVTGAVMFLFLLVFNQWKRLRPLYLPSGAALFLLIAAPWHLLAAQRNPQWVEFYFIHEHWLRFTTNTHDRFEPWWYFIPVLAAGLLPWTFLLPQALRNTLGAGWKERHQHHITWFLITWCLFIFLFFSRSQSKLAPYILPIFPALSLLIGAWLSDALQGKQARGLRWGLLLAAAMIGLLCTSILVIGLRPTLIRQSDLVLAVRSLAIPGASLLLLAASIAFFRLWTARFRSGFIWLASANMALLALVCAIYTQVIDRSSKPLAAIVSAEADAKDEIYHYRGFFHDFTYYTERYVGLVDTVNELEVSIDPAAQSSGRFIKSEDLIAKWNSGTRLWVMGRKSELAPLLQKEGIRCHLKGQHRNLTLISNKP